MRLKQQTHASLADALSTMLEDPEDTAAVKALLAERFAQLDTDGASVEDTATMQAIGNAAELLTGAPALAATGAVQRMARRGKPTPSPEAGRSTGTGLVAAGGAQGIAAGAPFADRMELARVMADTLQGLPRDGASRGRVVIASARWELPAERKLRGEEAMSNSEKIEAVCGLNAPKYDRAGALVATGGICQPVNVDYSVPTWATADRPIRDGLPAFEATRGGIRFVQPPDIAEWLAATGVWTEATDAEPGSATKPVVAMTCAAEESVPVEAVCTRIGFGNMQSRFAPEQVAANTEMAMAAAARVAEENLLNLIEAASVKKLETAAHLGISRDLIAAVEYARAAYKNIHRVSPTQSFTAILPDYVKDLIRVDLSREQAHSNNSDFNVWEISDEQIDAIFAQRHVNVIWSLDGQKAPTSNNYETQYWGTPAEAKKLDELLPKLAGGAKKALVWYFFPEGAVQFLDAGRLDLGVVRDSTLDATNDYECFYETFESIANRGVAHGVWQILSSVEATGGSAATVTAVAP